MNKYNNKTVLAVFLVVAILLGSAFVFEGLDWMKDIKLWNEYSDYVSDLYNIHYVNSDYSFNNDNLWIIKDEIKNSDDYVLQNIEQDGYELTLLFYNKDNFSNFLECVDNKRVYHNDSIPYPEDTLAEIDYIEVRSMNDDFGIQKIYDDKHIISDLNEIISAKPKNNIKFECKNKLYVYYKDYPAYKNFGEIGRDDEDNCWLKRTAYSSNDKTEKSDKFYLVPTNSSLISYINT